ncbi:MAG: biopolymer transporter ExbD [Gammaproteobacteria bacterium]|nr:MAG: biopolymer transporter ExbD [Gammaproteobacteria bacterium]
MRKHRRSMEDETEVDMTPMLDIVFIMLIFFIVTTSFIKESGIDITRPNNNESEAPPNPTSPILIRINDTGDVSLNGALIDVAQVEARVSAALSKKPKASVVVQVAEAAYTGILVGVVDAAKQAGVSQVTVTKMVKQ